MTSIPQCPNCGSTTVEYKYSTSTLMGYSQIIKDGEWQNCDPNWHTSHYTCCKCHHRFHIREQYGKIVDVTDEGQEQEIPIIEMPLTVSNDTYTSIETETLYIPNVSGTEVKYQWQIDIEDLQRQMKEVKEALERLEVNMLNGHSDLVEATQM